MHEWIDMRKGMLNKELKNDDTQLKRMPKTLRMIARRSSVIVKHGAVQSLIKSGQKFDLFFLGYNLNDMMLGLAGHFRVPTVIFSTIPAMKPLRDMLGNPAAVSSAPLFSKPQKIERLDFKQRLSLFIEYVFEYFYVSYTNHFLFQQFYDEHFGSIDNFPTFDEVKKNVSLIMTNTHFSEGTIRPALPNLIEVGGLHIKETPNPLPKVRTTSTEIFTIHFVYKSSFDLRLFAFHLTGIPRYSRFGRWKWRDCVQLWWKHTKFWHDGR